MRTLWRLTFFVLLVAVVYLSWKPSPSIMQVGWIPPVLRKWFDANDGWKNFIGFGLLALASLMAWRHPAGNLHETRRFVRGHRELKVFLGFCCFVVVMEIGQLALPLRTCDLKDILAGWAGGLMAWALIYVYRGVQTLLLQNRV